MATTRTAKTPRQYVAILAVYRELSVDEVAKMLKSGVQVLQQGLFWVVLLESGCFLFEGFLVGVFSMGLVVCLSMLILCIVLCGLRSIGNSFLGVV